MQGALEEVLVRNLTPLVTYPVNDSRIAQLYELVAKYGILRPIVATEDYYILDGNKLHTVLMLLGYNTAHVYVLKGTRGRHPLDLTVLQNLHSMLNVRLPYSYSTAIDPMLDILRYDMTQAIIRGMPETLADPKVLGRRRRRARAPKNAEAEKNSGGTV